MSDNDHVYGRLGFLDVTRHQKRPPKKTRVWDVYIHQDKDEDEWLMPGAGLGEVRWYAPWRRYVFEPAEGTLFDAECLQSMVQFLGDRMKERKR